MTVNRNHVVLVAGALVLTVLVCARPGWLSDSNDFLRNFVNHEYLNVLGVILAITLASLAQAHLVLNRIEEHRERRCFDRTRKEIKSSAYWLIVLFVIGFVIVMAKPIVCAGEIWAAAFNAASIAVLLVYVLILLDITMAMFKIQPELNNDDPPEGHIDGEA